MKPIIAIACCSKELRGYDVQTVSELYIKAIKSFSGIPLLIPVNLREADIDQIVGWVDGILLPGSHSNIDPARYGARHQELKMDQGRDALTFKLIRSAIDHAIPILGICRGFQEMNVALGGSLEPCVHKSGFQDHRESLSSNFAIKYSRGHLVYIEEGGCFSSWFEGERELKVNTLHEQGVRCLGQDLVIEARAPDGLVEAFSRADHPYFVGVQWHPEWMAESNPISRQLFARFILEACKFSDAKKLKNEKSD